MAANFLNYESPNETLLPDSPRGINSCCCFGIAAALLCVTYAVPNLLTAIVGAFLPVLLGIPYGVGGLLASGFRRRTAVIGIVLNVVLTVAVVWIVRGWIAWVGI